MSLDEMPIRLPEVHLQRVLLPPGGLMQEVQQRYGRALWQQAYKVLPSAALLGDPYGTLRRLRKGWLECWQQASQASWRELPVVALSGSAHLIGLALSNLLRATGTSTLALYNSLAALLAGERRFTADVSLLEGLLCGLGGLARETALGVGWLTRGKRIRSLPLALEGPLLMLLLPVGMARGVQRMLLLVAVGLLSVTRSTVEASRGLLRCHGAFAAPRPGRARAPREFAPCQPISPLSDPDGPAVMAALSQIEGMRHMPLLYAVHMHTPRGMLLLTTTAMIAADPYSCVVHWVLALEDVLLVQRQEALLRVLGLSTQVRGDTLLRHMGMPSASHAARLQELICVASSNSKSRALLIAPPVPTFLTVVLGPAGPFQASSSSTALAEPGVSCRMASGPACPSLSPAKQAERRCTSSSPTGPSLFQLFHERSIVARSSSSLWKTPSERRLVP